MTNIPTQTPGEAPSGVSPKRLFIHTFGCQMNELDSDKMAALMALEGFEQASEPQDADVILLNTCSIREKAEHKFHSALGRYRHQKEKDGTLIGVMGCVAQQEGETIIRQFPFVDWVMGPDTIPRLPEVVAKVKRGLGPVVDTAFDDSLEYPFVSELPIPVPGAPKKVSAFVTIQKGCDNKCTFCIVPTTRGIEISRASDEVVEEVQALVAQGIKEVTLLGQNVNSYGKKLDHEVDFAGLIHKVAKVDGLERIRFTTSHPRDLSDSLIEAFRTEPKLCSHFHLPVQSGANKILRRMKRYYTREWFMERVVALREARPDIVLTTDFIVGFPGETEEYFQETMSLLNEVRFEASFSFIYSERPGTPSLKLKDDVLPEDKKRRLAQLQFRQREIQAEAMRGQIGAVEEVLVEGYSKRTNEEMMGRTQGNRIVNFPGKARLVGSIVPVTITRAFSNSLKGEMVLAGV